MAQQNSFALGQRDQCSVPRVGLHRLSQKTPSPDSGLATSSGSSSSESIGYTLDNRPDSLKILDFPPSHWSALHYVPPLCRNSFPRHRDATEMVAILNSVGILSPDHLRQNKLQYGQGINSTPASAGPCPTVEDRARSDVGILTCSTDKENRLPSSQEFAPCINHGLSSALFCHDCMDDGCYMCMAESHLSHRHNRSITCYDLLCKEKVIKNQVDKCLKSLTIVSKRLENYQDTILHGLFDWQKRFGVQADNVAQIKSDFCQHENILESIFTRAKWEYDIFQTMMRKLNISFENGETARLHDIAKIARPSLAMLTQINAHAIEAIREAILVAKDWRDGLSVIVRTSGMEVLTQTPISSLEKLDSSWRDYMNGGRRSPIFESTPDIHVPSIPPVLKPLFQGCGVPSPIICDSFTFARTAPITPSTPGSQQVSSWPSERDQVQMERLEAVSQLLSPEPPVWVEIDDFESEWVPRTPQPMPSTSTTSWMPRTPQPQMTQFANQFGQPSPQRAPSPVELWEQIEQPGPSVPVPKLQKQQRSQSPQLLGDVNNGEFEIGFHTLRNYSQIRTPVLILEGKETETGKLSLPWGICCDENDLIYVADRGHNRIVIYGTDGKFVHAFGSEGEQPGLFKRPAGLAIDFRGRLVIADKDNHRIQVFSTGGEYLFHFGQYGNNESEFCYPWDVACSSNGHIAVSDSRNHRVQLFTHTGRFLQKYGWENELLMLKALDFPRGLIFVGNSLLVTDFNNHRIIQLEFGSTVVMKQFNKANDPKSILHRPQGLAQDTEGNILVCDSRHQRIVVFSPEGEYKAEFGKRGKENGQFERTADIAMAPDGKIVVVDLGNERVQIF